MHPTYFEMVTAMAFAVFKHLKVDTAVIEVGLGGRLDATNVIEPIMSVITPIDFDHEAWLGSSIEAIAAEKAGIIKHKTPVIIAPRRHKVVEELLVRTAMENRCPYATPKQPRPHRGDRRLLLALLVGGRGVRMWIDCPLAGEHQIDDAVTAAVALMNLKNIRPTGPFRNPASRVARAARAGG